MASPAPEHPDAPEAFAALDAYLESLHQGRPAERAQLLADHPQLAELVDCLDSLDRLAPSPAAHAATIPLHPSPDTSHQPVGTQFGKYELLGELGRGGMGIVCKARQIDLDRLVAIKMILASNLASPEQVQRFQAEAKAAARLQHPNIVRIYEAGELNGQQYFVMEHIEGPSLEKVLSGRPLEPQLAARLFADIARAVDYLHRQGILHRDLKPSNVLLSESAGALGCESVGAWERESAESGVSTPSRPHAPTPSRLHALTPKLTDFGLAKMLGTASDMTRTGAIVGTPSYMSPEQAAGRHKEVGPKSDVFSLGAILYELLTGRPPFRADTPLDTLVQVIEREPLPPRQLNPAAPAALELICLKCLEKPPERRYSSAGALADDLDRYLRGDEVEARPQNLAQRIWRWARGAPALASRLGAIGLFAVLIQLVYMIGRQVPLGVHLGVLGALAAWALVSWLFHRAIRAERQASLVRCVWAATDALVLTVVLALSDNATHPVVVFYALLIVGAGLWFRVSLVWFTTAAAELGYASLMAWAAANDVAIPYPHHQVLFMVSLAVLGYMVAYQVRRVRALSRYYENRPLS